MSFSLAVENDAARKTAAAWLGLGLAALLLAGLFSLLLVLSRTPGVQDLFPLKNFFKIALIIHVNLSVLIWFLAFAGVFWSLSAVKRLTGWDYLALALCLAGLLIMVATPLAGGGEPLMNNYVPVLDHGWFFTGLLSFAGGMVCLLGRTLLSNPPPLKPRTGGQLLHFAIYLAALSAMTALGAFIASYLGTPKTLSGEAYHEILFWGAGHVMQFTHTELMLVGWVLLACASGATFRLTPGWGMLLFGIVVAPLMLVPVIYLSYQAFYPGHLLAFTELMRLGGLGAIPLGALVVYRLVRSGKAGHNRHLRAVLWWSIALFASGGMVGFLIKGSNVMVPSHYHGCTVGVTLAFMGITYYLLPRLGFAEPNAVWARRQPWFYGGGQLVHILGLAWSGGYGVQRKAAGADQVLDQLPQILGMGMMGLGGLLSIIGGFVFVMIAFGAIMHKNSIGNHPPATVRSRV